MCTSRPKMPPPPPPPQEIKPPDSGALMNKARRNREGGIVNGSLLTGSTGVNPAAMNTGRASLLGQ